MNTVAKGNQFQNITRKYLEVAGYQVIVAKRASKFDTEIDFCGLWDLIAFRGKKRRYIQVCTNYNKPAVWQEQAEAFAVNEYETKEVWRYDDGQTYESGYLKGKHRPEITYAK